MATVKQHPNYPKYRVKIGVMPDFSGSNYVDQEELIGLMDGINKQFSTTYMPIKHSETLFKDGMFMSRASTIDCTDGDYYINYETKTITFADDQIPQKKSIMRISYKYMKQVDVL